MACSTGLEPKQEMVEMMSAVRSEMLSIRIQQEMQFEQLLKGQTRLHKGMDDVQQQLSQLGSRDDHDTTGNSETEAAELRELTRGSVGRSVRSSVTDGQGDQTDDSTELAFFHCHPWSFKMGEEFTRSLFSFANSIINPSWFFRKVAGALDTPYFDYGSAVLIVTNALVIGVQTELASNRPLADKEPEFFRISEKIFCVLFTLELMVRIFVLRFEFFTHKGWPWNVFDFFVVLSQWFEELFTVVSVTMESGRGYEEGSSSTVERFSVVRIVRILRLVRIVRLVRVMRLVAELRAIITSIFATLRSLMWTLVLLFIMIYMLAVYMTQLVKEEIVVEDAVPVAVPVDEGDSDAPEAPQCKEPDVLKELFGSLGRSILSLFQVVCGGLEWNGVLAPLMDKISPLMALLFCLYVAFFVFALSNVVTGVFLESALKTQKDDQEMVLMTRMKQILRAMDPYNTGKISEQVLAAARSSPEMQLLFKDLDVDPQEAKDLFTLIDINDRGEVSPEDFLSGCLRLRGSASSVDMLTFMHEYKRSQQRWSAQWKLIESSLINISRMLPTTKDETSVSGLLSRQPDSHAASEEEPETAHTLGQQSLNGVPSALSQNQGAAENGTMTLSEAEVLGDTLRDLAAGIQRDDYKISEVQDKTELTFFHHHPLNFRAGEDMRATPSSLADSRPNPSQRFRKAARALESPYFDYCSAFLIVTNALVLGVQTDLSASRPLSEEEPIFFRVSEKLFCVFFTIELVLRVYVLRCNFFTMSGRAWNIFDLLVVTSQWFEEVFWVLSITMESGSGPEGGSTMESFSVVRIIRILRLVRIVRLVRVMRLISELRTIISSIFNTLRSLMWTLVLLFIMIYMLAVYLTQLVKDELVGEKQDHVLKELFGSLGRSILSLFQVICGGLEWNGVVAPLMEKVSPLVAPLFCIYVAFFVFALSNVVTGVFLESTLRTAKDGQEMALLHRIKQILIQMAPYNAGTISWGDVDANQSTPEMKHVFKSIDVDAQEAKHVFALIDINDRGLVSFEDFLNGCLRLRGSASSVDMLTFMHEYKRSQERWSAQWKFIAGSLIKISSMVPTTRDGAFFNSCASSPSELWSRQPDSHVASEDEPATAWTIHKTNFSTEHIYI